MEEKIILQNLGSKVHAAKVYYRNHVPHPNPDMEQWVARGVDRCIEVEQETLKMRVEKLKECLLCLAMIGQELSLSELATCGRPFCEN